MFEGRKSSGAVETHRIRVILRELLAVGQEQIKCLMLNY